MSKLSKKISLGVVTTLIATSLIMGTAFAGDPPPPPPPKPPAPPPAPPAPPAPHHSYYHGYHMLIISHPAPPPQGITIIFK